MVSLCSEFPNDNPALHRGVSWLCLAVTGEPVAVRDAIVDVIPEPIETIPEPVEALSEPAEAIPEPAEAIPEAVEALPEPVSVAERDAVFDVDEVPAARISGIVPVGQDLHLDDDGADEILVEELPPLDETASVEGDVEALDAADELQESGAAPATATRVAAALPPAPDDPFTRFLTTLADVAIGAGSPHVASLLPGLLLEGRLDPVMPADAAQALAEAGVAQGTEVTAAFAARTRAWRAILDGTSDDFEACGGAMLDEWAADLLARLLGAPSRATSLRSELRSRGVAAFGLAFAA